MIRQVPRGLRLESRSLSHRVVTQLSKDHVALASTVVLLLIILAAIFAPVVAPFDPVEIHTPFRLRPPLWAGPDGRVHILGTDSLGRDVLSRVIHGARVSLLVGIVTVAIGTGLGLSLGVVAGYVGGWIDYVICGLINIQLAFPFIVLAIAVVAVLGPGLRNLVFVLGIFGWLTPARVIRAEVLSIREREFVEAARALGASPQHIVVKHIVPNVLAPTLVTASFAMAWMIIGEAALSFVGLGVPPPYPSWGSMLADGRTYLSTAWWVSTAPGLALTLTVLSINVVGDFLRDTLDPTLQLT